MHSCLDVSRACGLFVNPQAPHTNKHTGPLVLRSQTHLHFFRNSREALLMGSLLYFRPPAEAIPCFPCMPCNTAYHGFAHSVHEYTTQVCRSCFSLQAWLLVHALLPAPVTFQDTFFTLLGGLLQQPPASVLLLPFLLSTSLLNVLLFIPTGFRQPLLQVDSFSKGAGHGLQAALLSV